MNPFEMTPVGERGVEVTRLGLGGVFISGRGPVDGSYPTPAYETALATIAAAHEVGIRYFDTAPLYGNGRSERRLGKVLGELPARLVCALDQGGTGARARSRPARRVG